MDLIERLSMRFERFLATRLNYNSLTKFLMRVNYKFLGYPRFTDAKIESIGKLTQTTRTDYEYIKGFNTHLNLIQVCWTSICLTTFIKNLAFPIYTIATIEKYRIQYARLTRKDGLGSGSNSFKTDSLVFGCLWTNCTQFSPNIPSVKELVTFPVFKLCNPNLTPFSFPVLDTHSFGLIIHCACVYMAFLFAVVLPLYLYIRPIAHEIAIFPVTPEVVIRSQCEVLRKYLIELNASMINFFQTTLDSAAVEAYEIKKIGKTICSNQTMSSLLFNIENAKLNSFAPETKQILQLKDYNKLTEKAINFLEDCLPIVRTRKYQSMFTRQYCTLFIVVVFYLILLALFGLYSTQWTTIVRENEFKRIMALMEVEGCAILRNESANDCEELSQSSCGSSRIERVDLTDNPIRWTLLTFIDYFIAGGPIIFVLGCSTALSIVSLQEISIQIVEQLDRIQLAIEITEVLKCMKFVKSHTKGYDLNDNHSYFSFAPLRTQHFRRIKFYFGLSFAKPIWDQRARKLEDTTSRLRDAAIEELIVNGPTLDIYLSVLVKLYLGSRGLMQLVKEASSNLSVMLSFCYATSYGLIILVVVINRRIGASDVTSIVVVFVGLLVTNLIISTASNVQTKSKRLTSLTWQLIAAMAPFKDIRLQHMRSLWTRQVIVLTREGGLSLKAFNMEINYASVIQMMLWSATLALIAFSY